MRPAIMIAMIMWPTFTSEKIRCMTNNNMLGTIHVMGIGGKIVSGTMVLPVNSGRKWNNGK